MSRSDAARPQLTAGPPAFPGSVVRALLPFALSTMLLTTGATASDVLTDGFSAGIEPALWTHLSNQPLYSWNDAGGDVLFSKAAGGSGGLDFIGIFLERIAVGDFDVQAAFSQASIQHLTGAVGNQVQLNVRFGGQLLAVVRSDETAAGNNAHVYADPPIAWVGSVVATSASAETLRVVRTGTTVSAYYGATLLHQGTYGTDPVTAITLTLQNNATQDPVSVHFDDFSLTADTIIDATIFVDGFESGDTLLWSSTLP